MKTFCLFFFWPLLAIAYAQDCEVRLRAIDEEMYPVMRVCGQLSNRDVVWGRGYAGLDPFLSPNASSVLSRYSPEVREFLVASLEEKERFAIAHVLLTMASGERYPRSDREWNRLRVQVGQVGEGSYDDTQMKEIRDYWVGRKGRK